MTNVAVLGASIDPTGAVQGAARAVQAAQSMAAGMKAAQNPWVTAAQSMGTAARQMGQATEAGARQATAAVQSAASSGAWERIRSQARSVASGIGTAFDSLRSRAANFASSAGNSVVAAFSRIRAAAAGLGTAGGGFLNIANAAGFLNNRIGGTINQLAAMGSMFRGVGGAAGVGTAGIVAFSAVLIPLGIALLGIVGTLAAVSAAVALIGKSMSAAGSVQSGFMGLSTVIGDAKEATRVLSELRELSRRTGQDLDSNLNTTTKFVALGFSTDDALKLNQSVADIAGTLGLSKQRAAELSNALAQVQSKGVVSMEELRQQIAEKGIPVMDDLAKKIGKTGAELSKLVEQGKVPAKALIDIFLNMEGSFSKFSGGAERATKTLPGAIDRLKANWNDLLITMGSPINDAITPMINQISDAMADLQGAASDAGKFIADAIMQIRALAAVSFMSGKELDMKQYGSGFELVMKSAWDTIKGYATQIIGALGDVMKNRFEIAVFELEKMFSKLQTPEFWKGLSKELTAAATAFVDTITLGLSSAARELKAALGEDVKTVKSFGSDLAKLGEGIITLDGSKITEALYGKAAPSNPTAPAASTVPTPVQQPKTLTLSDALTKNAQPQTAPQADLSKLTTDWLKKQKPIEGPPAPPVTNKPYSPVELLEGSKQADKLARQMEASAKRYIEANRTPLEKYAATVAEVNALQAAGLLSIDQAARASVAALDALNEGTRRAAEKAATPLEKLMMQWGDLKTQIQSVNAAVADTFADGVTGAVTSLINGTATAAEAFSAMAASIVQDITKMIVKMMVQYAIQQALGLVTGGVSTATFTAASATAASVNHSSGTVGGAGSTFRSVPASNFRNAPKFAHGGDIASGETPIIAEPGEKVLTRDQASDIKKRLGDTSKKEGEKSRQGVTIMNFVDPNLVRDAIAKNPDIILNAVSSQASKIKRVLA